MDAAWSELAASSSSSQEHARRTRSISRSQSEPTNLSSSSALGVRELEGWLTKQGSLWRTWRERWFRLCTTTGQLYYYKLMHDTQPLGFISLEGARVAEDDSRFWRGVYGWIIYVEVPEKRELLLCTKQKQSRDEWVTAIQALIQLKATGRSLTSPLSASLPSFSTAGERGEDLLLDTNDSYALSVDETPTGEAPTDTEVGSLYWRRTHWIAAYKGHIEGFEQTSTKRFVQDQSDFFSAGGIEPRGVLGLHAKHSSVPVPVLLDVSNGYLAYAVLALHGMDLINTTYMAKLQAKEGPEWRQKKANYDRREQEREREEKRTHSEGDTVDSNDGETDDHHLKKDDDKLGLSTPAFPPLMKRVIFNGTEGWMLGLALKQLGYLRIAANSFDEIQQWARFLLSPPSSRGSTMAVNGFLWLGRDKGLTWERFYCISDGSKFEYYKIKSVELVNLQSVTKVETSWLVYGGPRKPSLSKREMLVDVKHYNCALNLYTDAEKISFMTQDDEQALFWKQVLEVGPISRLDTSKTVKLLKKSLEGVPSDEDDLAGETPTLVRSATEPLERTAVRSSVLTRATSELGASAGSSATRAATLANAHKHYFHAELALHSGVFTQAPLDRITNITRRLCEQADEETGKSPLGNYPASKPIAARDGHYRILALDGGGLRAIIEAVILSRLVEVFPDLLQRVDLIAGVSGGAMVASGLAIGRSPTFIREMLKSFAPHFFKPKTRNTLQGLALSKAKYANEPLLAFGEEIFKNMSIRDVPKRILISSFLVDNEAEDEDRSWEPRVYHNIPLRPDQQISSEEELSAPVWHAVMGSAAAPTFFPSFQKHIDGAVMVNNPSLLAITMTMSEQALHPVDPSRIHLLSLGTGHLQQFLGGDEHDWGVLQWAPKLPELLVAGGLGSQLLMVKMLLGSRFHQLNPVLEKFLPMDDHTITNELIDIGNKVDLTDTINWITEHFYETRATPAARPSEAGRQPTTTTNREKRRALKISRSSTHPADAGGKGELLCDVGAWYNSAYTQVD